MFSGVDLELIEDMPPDGFHLVPVLDDTMLHRVVKLDDPLVLLGLLPDEILVIVQSVYHDFLVLRASNANQFKLTDGYLLRVEHKCWLVLSAETCFHDARALD